MRILFRPLSVLLSGILAVGSCLEAQNVTPTDSSEVQELHIRVVEGAAPGRTASQPVTVAVSDGSGSPVSNATVLFRLPADAPTGLFSDGSRVAIAHTDLQGLATVNNIQWRASSGVAVIRVTASKGTVHAGILIEQVLGRSKHAAALTPPTDLSVNPSSSSVPPVPDTAGIVHPSPAAAPVPVGQPAQGPAESSQKPILMSAKATTMPVSAASEQPTVQITTNRPVQLTGASGKSKKWLWIGIGGAAAAGMALAFVGKGGAGSGSSQNSGAPPLSIGTPSVSIGHP